MLDLVLYIDKIFSTIALKAWGQQVPTVTFQFQERCLQSPLKPEKGACRHLFIPYMVIKGACRLLSLASKVTAGTFL